MLALKKGLWTFSSLLVLLMVAACERTPQLQNVQGYAQGTTYSITWWADKPTDKTLITQDFQQTLNQIDKELSTWREDSFISHFNRSQNTDWVQASPDFIYLLRVAGQVYQKTQGCYDPTVGPLFDLWGFKAGKLHVPSAAQIQAVKASIGFQHIHINASGTAFRKDLPTLAIDLSSMGEGYTIGKLSAVLERHGITNYLVEFGGDMKVRGHKPKGEDWRVGIEQPVKNATNNAPYRIAEITAHDGVTLDTSGTYEHFFDEAGNAYSHILDPRTGAPVKHHLISASVFGKEPALSDAWATAMLCLGDKEGMQIAKQQRLAVFFIQREQGELESQASPALRQSNRVILKKPQ